jgi:hypothetical protein
MFAAVGMLMDFAVRAVKKHGFRALTANQLRVEPVKKSARERRLKN